MDTLISIQKKRKALYSGIVHSHQLVVGERYVLEITDTGPDKIRDNCLEITDVIGLLCNGVTTCNHTHKDGWNLVHTIVARLSGIIDPTRPDSRFRGGGSSTLTFTDFSLYDNSNSRDANPPMFRPIRDIVFRSELVRCFDVAGVKILARGMLYAELAVVLSKMRGRIPRAYRRIDKQFI